MSGELAIQIVRGLKSFEKLKKREDKFESVRDYVLNGAKKGAYLGGYLGVGLGVAAPFAGGWILGDYFAGAMEGVRRYLFNAGSSIVAGLGLMPYSLRLISTSGAGTGAIIGRIIGGIQGIFEQEYKNLANFFGGKKKSVDPT